MFQLTIICFRLSTIVIVVVAAAAAAAALFNNITIHKIYDYYNIHNFDVLYCMVVT